jgi:hypothetical protein
LEKGHHNSHIMRAVLALILAVSVSAFTTSNVKTSQSVSLNAVPFNKEVGAQAPVGFFE